jgi:hypothetical protein
LSRYLAKYVAGINESNTVYTIYGITYIHAATKKEHVKKCESFTRGSNTDIRHSTSFDVGNTGESRRGLNALHEPAGLVVENVFLHKTKITLSAINEKKAHKLRSA